MFQKVDRVKERRRERIDSIRMQMRDGMPPFLNELNDPIDESYSGYRPSTFPNLQEDDEPPNRMPPQDRLGLQTFGALLLIGLAYLLFQSNVGLPSGWRETAKEVMTRDYNFQAVGQWYESTFGQLPSVLPAFAGKDSAVPAQSSLQREKWSVPREWKVVQPFDSASGRIVVDVGAVGKVYNAQNGWVTFVGDKPGLGLTVVIQYANQREAWFTNLEQTGIHVNDWVYPGDPLGVAKPDERNQSRQLVLLIKEREKFIDPLDVIPIE